MKRLIVGLLLSLNVYANTIEVVSKNKVSHGDPVNLVLRVERILGEAELNQALEKSEKKIGPFYIHNVGFIKPGSNETIIGLNAFYDDPKVLGAARLALPTPINLSFTNPELLERIELKPEQEFRYYIRSFNLPSEMSFVFTILASIFIFIGFVLLKRFRDHQQALKEEKEYHQNWIRAFKACYKREDFERIYKERKKWMPLVGSTSKKFIKTLNKHQYKKEWSQEDMAKVTEDFNKVKEKLISNGI